MNIYIDENVEDQKDSLAFLKLGCMRYLSMVSVLPTVDGGRHAPSLGEQQEY